MATTSQFRKSESSLAARPKTIVLALLMAGWIAATGTDRAAGQAVVNGLMVTTVDEPLKYHATGPVNTSNAWSNANPGPAVAGPWYAVPRKAPPAPPAADPGIYWEFSVRHSATEFKEKKTKAAQLHVKGQHIRVPQPGHNEGPNILPEIGTPAIDIPEGKSANVANWGGLEHLGQDPPHNDYYGVASKKMKYSVVGATATLGGEVEVVALHSEGRPKVLDKWESGATLVSSGLRADRGGSTVSFNAETGTLSFAPGRIDVLDRQGGLTGNIDPRYASDPILGAHLSVSDLVFQGRQPDGRYRFSGGNVSVTDELGQLSLRASFDEYLIGDTSQQQVLDSFGVLSRGESFELLDTELPTFLGDFVNSHVLGRVEGYFDLYSERVMDLAVITHPGMDLATLTNGFTTSAMFVPADIHVGGGGYNVSSSPSGDYNSDGLVDSRDYAVWHDNFGMPGSPADGNGNGIVDAADYTVWRDHAGVSFGHADAGYLVGNAIAIPEPSPAALAMIALCLAVPACRSRRFSLQVLCSAIAALVVPNLAAAAAITIQAGDPQLPGMVSSVWRSPAGDAIHEFGMPVQGNMTSSDMAVATRQSLLGIPGVDPASVSVTGDRVIVNSTPLFDPLDGVLPGGSIYWSPGTTAQESMMLSSPNTIRATVAVVGHFDPLYQPFQPASFTAGIVTDVGVLSAKVSAQELSFQTDGPIICQALFQRLAPRAPQFGAQINYAGDRLEVYFDPAYTVTQGGIIFGTTSPSPGYSGTITAPPSPPILIPGDYNGDGSVDSRDYTIWHDDFGMPSSHADGNGNGVADAADYTVWRDHAGANIGLADGGHLEGNAIAIPEPSLAALAMIALCLAVPAARIRSVSERSVEV